MRRFSQSGIFATALLTVMAACSCCPAAEDLGVLEQQAFRGAVDRVAPSVVRIETIGGLERVGKILFGAAPTTGTVVSADGYIISSAFNFTHSPASILVQLPDGSRKAAKMVATDHNRMITLLQIEGVKLPVPETAPEKEIRVGQWAVAVGRTFEENQPNMAVGIVSAVNRIWGKAIQTDAAVSPNNYGGPLVDIRGRVMGVLVPLSPQDTSDVAGYEWYDSGIGFAIPFEKVQELLPKLKEGKDLKPGVIGIQFPAAALTVAESVVAGCRPRSPAQRAGLKVKDRIVEIDGQKVSRAAQVKQELSRRYAGDKLRVTVDRQGQRSEHEVELVAKLEPYQHAFLGVLPEREAKTERKPEAKTGTQKEGKPQTETVSGGIAVRYVYPDSPAAKAGVQRGDVLVEFSGEPIQDASQLRAKIGDCEPQQTLGLGFRRDKETRKVEVKLATLPEAIPPDDVPPAGNGNKPGGAKQQQVGAVQFKLPDFANNEVWAYVPEDYDPAVPQGVVIWLHGVGALKEKELLDRWKPLCDRHRLILVAPKAAEAGKWQLREVGMLQRLLAHISSTYSVDPTRVAVAADQGAGPVAFGLAFSDRAHVRAVAVVESGVSGRLPENEPGQRLAVYVARSEKSPTAVAVKQSIASMQEAKYPVTIKELGPSPRPLTSEELAELARWIDALDRI